MVVLEILSPLLLTSREDGRDILELWQTYIPELLPDYYGNWEPIDRPFDRQNLEAALDQWKWPFLSIKKRPFAEFQVWMGKGPQQQLHATLTVTTEPKVAIYDRLLEFLKAASVRLRADFACLHLMTQAEYQRGRSNKTVKALDKQGKKLYFSLVSQDLKQRIPDLYWATVLGAPYLEMFGKVSILSAPASAASSLSNDQILLQMTENLTDVEKHPEVFDQVRSRVKDYLGEEAFFDIRNEASHAYRAPTFKFFDESGL
jgi:hypothetical protein